MKPLGVRDHGPQRAVAGPECRCQACTSPPGQPNSLQHDLAAQSCTHITYPSLQPSLASQVCHPREIMY